MLTTRGTLISSQRNGSEERAGEIFFEFC